MRVAIYVRVSTRNQVHTQTIEQQIERLHAFIAAQGWELPNKTSSATTATAERR